MHELTQLCTFHLGDLYFGVQVDSVQEIIREQSMTRVPLSHNAIGGLINLRGQIVTAIDLRTRLGVANDSEQLAKMNVVICTSDGVVSLLVDSIGDVVQVESSSFETPPETLREPIRSLITGVYKLSNRLLLVLDTTLAVNLGAMAA